MIQLGRQILGFWIIPMELIFLKKFGNKENNIIEIDVIEMEEFYQFSINDNGIGIDKKFHEIFYIMWCHTNYKRNNYG